MSSHKKKKVVNKKIKHFEGSLCFDGYYKTLTGKGTQIVANNLCPDGIPLVSVDPCDSDIFRGKQLVAEPDGNVTLKSKDACVTIDVNVGHALRSSDCSDQNAIKLIDPPNPAPGESVTLKTLVAGTNINLSEANNCVTIKSTAAGGYAIKSATGCNNKFRALTNPANPAAGDPVVIKTLDAEDPLALADVNNCLRLRLKKYPILSLYSKDAQTIGTNGINKAFLFFGQGNNGQILYNDGFIFDSNTRAAFKPAGGWPKDSIWEFTYTYLLDIYDGTCTTTTSLRKFDNFVGINPVIDGSVSAAYNTAPAKFLVRKVSFVVRKKFIYKFSDLDNNFYGIWAVSTDRINSPLNVFQFANVTVKRVF